MLHGAVGDATLLFHYPAGTHHPALPRRGVWISAVVKPQFRCMVRLVPYYATQLSALTVNTLNISCPRELGIFTFLSNIFNFYEVLHLLYRPILFSSGTLREVKTFTWYCILGFETALRHFWRYSMVQRACIVHT